MNKNSKIYVAGHRGMAGSAIIRDLSKKGYTNLIGATREQVNLTEQLEVAEFFRKERPEYVILAAAKVGGILENKNHPAEFMYDNLMIQTNIMDTAHVYGVKKLLFLGTSCIYPSNFDVPITEDDLLNGPLEPTNEAYSIAKIAGIKMAQYYRAQYGANYISVMPPNLYGPGDNFSLDKSHVLGAFIRKFHDAKVNKEPSVTCWGTGAPKREFLYVEDFADCCEFLMNNYDSPEIINAGIGYDVEIRTLAETVAWVVGYTGDIVWDISKPNGTMRKLLDSTKINELGWKPKTYLTDGIKKTYDWFLEYAKL